MFKLTLRELFLVVTLAAVLVAWWLDHNRSHTLLAQAQTRQVFAEARTTVEETAKLEIVDRYARLYSAIRKRGMYVDVDKTSGKYPKVAVRGSSTPDLELSARSR